MLGVKEQRALSACMLIVAGLLVACRPVPHIDKPSTLNIQQIRSSFNADQASQVRFEGIVTLVNPSFGLIVLQDDTAGIVVQPLRFIGDSLTGHRVEVVGTTHIGTGADAISDATVRDLGRAKLPEPRFITAKDLRADTFDGERVSLVGTARAGRVDAAGQLVIPVIISGFEVLARVLDDHGIDTDRLVDAEIRVTGVAATGLDIDGKLTDLAILIADKNGIELRKRARDPESLPVEKIKTILQGLTRAPDHRVRLQGRIEDLGDEHRLQFGDGSGRIAIPNGGGLETTPAGVLDVTAFLDHSNGYWALQDVKPTFKTTVPIEPSNNRALVTTVAELRAMKAEQAALERPVLLDGVVTYYDPAWQSMFFQDETGGVYVSLHGADPAAIKVADRIRVRGVSGAGDFAPVVQKPVFQFLQRGSLPKPSALNAEAIFSGWADSQFVELEGIVESIGLEANHPYAKLSWGSHQYKILFPPGTKIPQEWIDVGFRVRGACGTLFNGKRQVLGIQLFLQGVDQMEPLPDGETTGGHHRTMPITAIDKLLQFDPHEMPGHRIHVRGKVLVAHAEGPTWIKDDSGAVAIHEHNEISLNAGDIVDVVGFASPGTYAAEIHEGSITKRASGAPVRPIDVTPERALVQGMDGQLVQLQGRLMSEYRNGFEQILLLRNGKATFTARGIGNLPVYEAGAVLRLSGVCSVSAKRFRGVLVPRAFEIAVDSPDAITVVEAAPWLTQQRAWRALTITSILVAAALVWVFMLRRRVSGQTRLIKQKLLEVEKLKEKAEAASAAKSQFLANMSHEIRTPMNGILGMTELAMQAESPEEQNECLSTIRSSGDALLTILNDLLDLSKIEAGKFEIELAPFSIRELIKDAGKVFAFRMKEKRLRFESSVGELLPDSLIGDVLRLRQILLNLLGNAVKFTPAGSISLTAGGDVDGDMVNLRLMVRDSGIGIPAEKQSQIFEAFRQADDSTAKNYGGTGLGLSICVKLVALMGGKINVDSEVANGSTFSIVLSLKIAPPPIQRALNPVELEPKNVGRLNILLAEDNAVNQTLAVKLLKKQGHQVTVAANGRLAVEEFERGGFDLILMDVQMPEMDGLEATSEIRRIEQKKGTRIPIIAMTAQTMKGDRDNCFAAGMDSFVSKPVRLPELWAAIAAIKPVVSR
jgi:signal transduction histidine kinase/CheY-like chemotaxis protein